MSLAAPVAGTGLTPTLHLQLPLPAGDPARMRELAAAFERLADELGRQVAAAVDRVDGLQPEWAGVGAAASRHTALHVADLATEVQRGLRSCARELADYADRLQRAHEHHGWSIGKLVTLGAIVVATGGALGVTLCGAAAVAGTVEAGAATAAVEGATGAADAATAAAESAADGLAASSSSLAELQELTRLLLPHLASGVLSAAPGAFMAELRTGRIDWPAVADSFVAGATESTVAEALDASVEGKLAAAAADDWRRLGAPYLIRAATGAGGTVAQDLLADQPVSGDATAER